MPIYEFVCGSCDERFEALVDTGTERLACRECGAEGAQRVMSAPGPAPRLAKTPRQARRVEDARGVGRDGAKQRFKETRRKQREAAPHRKEGEKP